MSLYAHHHELSLFPPASRVTEYDPTDPLAHVDRYTDVVVLRPTRARTAQLGDEPRRYIGGTVWLLRTLCNELPEVARLLTVDQDPDSVWIQINTLWLPFRTCDVRYPTPAHIRLERGEALHDTDLRSAVRWD